MRNTNAQTTHKHEKNAPSLSLVSHLNDHDKVSLAPQTHQISTPEASIKQCVMHVDYNQMHAKVTRPTRIIREGRDNQACEYRLRKIGVKVGCHFQGLGPCSCTYTLDWILACTFTHARSYAYTHVYIPLCGFLYLFISLYSPLPLSPFSQTPTYIYFNWLFNIDMLL